MHAEKERDLKMKYYKHHDEETLGAYNLTSALLGWLGAFNLLLIGIYITTTCLDLAILFPKENFLTQAYATSFTTGILTLMLIYGSYLQLKRRVHNGGIINLTAGTIFFTIYLYFTWLSNPPFLEWLGFIGYFLPAPALASGVLGILSKDKHPKRVRTHYDLRLRKVKLFTFKYFT